MKKIPLISMLTLALFASTSFAREGFSVKPSFIYYSNKTDTNTTSGATYTWLDLSAGYTMLMGFYVGAMYHMPSITEHGTSDCTYQHTGYGPSVGYRGDQAYIIGTYFISNQRSGCGNTYKNGSHYQVDVGYGFDISSNVQVAPQLTYYSYQYADNATTNIALDPKVTYSGVVPMIAIVIVF
jgi:hypothetical protein